MTHLHESSGLDSGSVESFQGCQLCFHQSLSFPTVWHTLNRDTRGHTMARCHTCQQFLACTLQQQSSESYPGQMNALQARGQPALTSKVWKFLLPRSICTISDRYVIKIFIIRRVVWDTCCHKGSSGDKDPANETALTPTRACYKKGFWHKFE